MPCKIQNKRIESCLDAAKSVCIFSVSAGIIVI